MTDSGRRPLEGQWSPHGQIRLDGRGRLRVSRSKTEPRARQAVRIRRSFFARSATEVARDLLGQRLVRLERGGRRLSGWIIEAEAYLGRADLASHARHGRTARNSTMWGPPGHAYVYFTYGMHWMLNLVTERDGEAGAVLLRGLLPDEGVDIMRRRRGREDPGFTDGPAKLCQALGIDRRFDGSDVCASDAKLYLAQGRRVPDEAVTIGPRVGLNHVPEPWFSRPWRFRVDPHTFREWLERGAKA
jgi:DNA-3-methyladenine glycosylase